MRKTTAQNIPERLKSPRLRKSPHPLARPFFERDPRLVAPELLGKVLVRQEGRSLRAGRIVEVEVYLGADDAAAHAAAGETARNRVLFGPAGRAYVYFTYGMHYCLNVSCMRAGEAGSVLIRALEPLAGISAMTKARGIDERKHRDSGQQLRLIASGPGRLCQAMSITRPRDNGKDLTGRTSGLWIGNDGYLPQGIIRTPRIGITKSVEMPLRYFVAGNEFVSGRRQSVRP